MTVRHTPGTFKLPALENFAGEGAICDYLYSCLGAHMSPNTIRSRGWILAAVQRALGADLAEATDAAVLRWWETRGMYRMDGTARPLSAARRAAILSHLRTFYAWALRTGRRTDPDPTRNLAKVRVPRAAPRPLDSARALELYRSLAGSDRRLIGLMLLAGLRATEVARAHPADLRTLPASDRTVLSVLGKGGRHRDVPLAADLAADLAAAAPDQHYVLGRTGEPMSPDAVSRRATRILALGRLVGTGHQLRHTFATAAYAATRDVIGTGALLGHASPAATVIYAGVAALDLVNTVDAMYATPRRRRRTSSVEPPR